MIETLGQYKILELAGAGTVGRGVSCPRHTGRADRGDHGGGRCRSPRIPERREQFLRDARAAAAVSHPNIVTLYEVGEDDGRLYLVYEFVQGQTLKNVIGGRPLNPRRAVDLASQIAEALADAHAADLVHGAITADSDRRHAERPREDRRFRPGRRGPRRRRTRRKRPRPRQANRPAYRADLSSLGVILFEMLTGRAPAPGAGVPSAVNRSLPREIDPIVARALGKSGGYESAATLAAELRAVGAMLDVRQEASDAAAPRASVAQPEAVARRSDGSAVVAAVVDRGRARQRSPGGIFRAA